MVSLHVLSEGSLLNSKHDCGNSYYSHLFLTLILRRPADSFGQMRQTQKRV